MRYNKTTMRYCTTKFEVRVRRDDYSLQTHTVETIGPYLAELLADDKRLSEIDFDAEHSLGCSKDQIEQRHKALQEEINHCRYFLLMAKEVKEPGFDEWVFIREKPVYDWQPNYDRWTRDNGKLVATIQKIPTTSRTKLKVTVETSNPAKECGFDFTSYLTVNYETHAFVKKERIEREVEDAKSKLDTLLANCRPRNLSNELL